MPVPRTPTRRAVHLLLVVVSIGTLMGAAPFAPADDGTAYGTRIPVPGLRGALVIGGFGPMPDSVRVAFVGLAGGAEARLVLLAAGPMDEHDDAALLERWSGHVRVEPSVVRLGPGAETIAAAASRLRRADGIWINAMNHRALLGDLALRQELVAMLERGATIGGAGAAGAVLGELFDTELFDTGPLGEDSEAPSGATAGLGLLGGCVLRPFTALRSRRAPPTAPPGGYVHLAVSDRAALVVRGRRGRVVGEGRAIVHIPASGDRAAHRQSVGSGQLIDLIALSRAAVARAGAPFPPAQPSAPAVAGGGTLFIGGGGPMPTDAVRRFVAAAGGPRALILVIPTALGEGAGPARGRQEALMLRRLGAKRVEIVDAGTPEAAESPEILALLREAGGIWFSGGRQWRLVDSYLDTQAHELMGAMLARGGAVFGSSAGASIQAEYMVRGHPLGNHVMMAEGYERGLGFLPGVAVDQHFSQRHRFNDMARLKLAHPQLVGIGIDEATVLIVRGHLAEVAGENRVAVYDRPPEPRREVGEYRLLRPGDRYDLASRRLVGRGGE